VDSARELQRQLDGERKTDHDASERRIGITKEAWYVAPTQSGDQFVAYMEGADFNKALSMFVQSRDEFDLWFKEQLADATGVDLNDPPELKLPELVSSYESTKASRARRLKADRCTHGSHDSRLRRVASTTGSPRSMPR
jgi:hypothetical protein